MKNIHTVIRILKKEIKKWKTPAVGVIAEESKDPFQVLISCLLSLRTKDEVTDRTSQRLFAKASTPQDMLKLDIETIQKLIYPVCFYRVKAQRILEICWDIMHRFQGHVPNTLDELLTLKGVGRKTANLVLTLGFDKEGICVDTHVHRISNRWKLVKTKTADETEFALRKVLPKSYWKIFNDLLVPYGQNLCRPISPFCSLCKISPYCAKHGVSKHR